MTKVLVTGANGMLGQDLCPILEDNGYEVIETDIQNLDITNSKMVEKVFLKEKPDYVIHCAAFSDYVLFTCIVFQRKKSVQSLFCIIKRLVQQKVFYKLRIIFNPVCFIFYFVNFYNFVWRKCNYAFYFYAY